LKTKKSAYKSIRIIKILSHLEWGAKNSVLLNLYRSLVRSKLDYGSICYGNSNCNISKIHDLVHKTGLKCATGAFRSSPISSLLAITVEPPFQYHRIRLQLKYITRILSTPDDSTIVVVVDNEFYTLGTKEGVINQLYTHNQFAVYKEQLLSPENVATN